MDLQNEDSSLCLCSELTSFELSVFKKLCSVDQKKKKSSIKTLFGHLYTHIISCWFFKEAYMQSGCSGLLIYSCSRLQVSKLSDLCFTKFWMLASAGNHQCLDNTQVPVTWALKFRMNVFLLELSCISYLVLSGCAYWNLRKAFWLMRCFLGLL